MLTASTHHGIYVLDQDEALDFYVGTLGLEVSADIDVGFMRWLTVCVPGDDHQILLGAPGPPAHDDATAAQVRELITKGALAPALMFSTDDARRLHAELRDKGVDMLDEPVEQPYGIDFGIRDPFGNQIRITEPSNATPEEIERAFVSQAQA